MNITDPSTNSMSMATSESRDGTLSRNTKPQPTPVDYGDEECVLEIEVGLKVDQSRIPMVGTTGMWIPSERLYTCHSSLLALGIRLGRRVDCEYMIRVEDFSIPCDDDDAPPDDGERLGMADNACQSEDGAIPCLSVISSRIDAEAKRDRKEYLI